MRCLSFWIAVLGVSLATEAAALQLAVGNAGFEDSVVPVGSRRRVCEQR
jgi:hypothetical protein